MNEEQKAQLAEQYRHLLNHEPIARNVFWACEQEGLDPQTRLLWTVVELAKALHQTRDALQERLLNEPPPPIWVPREKT